MQPSPLRCGSWVRQKQKCMDTHKNFKSQCRSTKRRQQPPWQKQSLRDVSPPTHSACLWWYLTFHGRQLPKKIDEDDPGERKHDPALLERRAALLLAAEQELLLLLAVRALARLAFCRERIVACCGVAEEVKSFSHSRSRSHNRSIRSAQQSTQTTPTYTTIAKKESVQELRTAGTHS